MGPATGGANAPGVGWADLLPAPAALTRPSYSLYELWCFLAVSRALGDTLPHWDWKQQGLSHLLGVEGTGAGAKVVGRWGNWKMEVEFNPSFAGYLNRGQRERWSLSGERRPDIVISLSEGEGGRWLCLDAKYRVSQSNLADAFESAHIYRDALRWTKMGGSCRAALLLAPAMSPEVAPWFEPTYREAHHTGVWQLAPGGDSSPLARWILNALEWESVQGVNDAKPG